jgi:hypothetical protein
MARSFAAGQRWAYRAPEGYQSSRIVIGAIVSFEGREPVICCMVTEAPQRGSDGATRSVAIPFIPMAHAAFEATVTELDGTQPVTPAFLESYEHWKADARGLSYFTVPFEGSLSRLIALQMAALVEG